MPEYNALLVDTRGTGIQPVVKVTSCKRAPEEWWIFDDSSLTFGALAAPATTVAMARRVPYVLGGQIKQPELSRGDAPVLSSIKYWKLSVGMETGIVGGMLDLAKTRCQGTVEEPAK
eukprot:3304876-Pleurochrysis_carterae.AAC.1